MKTLPFCLSLPLFAALATIVAPSLSAQIINIDFLAQGAPPETSASPNFGGPGPIGSGVFYNGLSASDTTGSTLLTTVGTGLKDSNNLATTVNVSFGPSGADNNGNGVATAIGPVNGGYLYTGSSLAFTITGLGAATTENLLFTTSDYSDLGTPVPTFTNGGGTRVTYMPQPTDTLFVNGTGVGSGTQGDLTGNTYEYDNVKVVGGTITGSLSELGGGTLILSAVTIEGAAPEPSTYAMMFAGLVALGFVIRRKSAQVQA
jgi:hypothetical protein